MQFEILGQISDVETFAAGSGVREIARLRRIYGRGRWRKRKGIARGRLSMALCIWLKYTGMKQPVSFARNSRSRICCEGPENAEARIETAGRMH
jgi:hypothetical protein